MIILKEQNTNQTLYFIPRNGVVTSYKLIDEETNTEITETISSGSYSYYTTITDIFDLKQGKFYNLTIYASDDIVYRDKVFCTNQVIGDYTINKDEYVANATTNEYIVYE